MANWILAPCLVSLRHEFDRLAPYREKTSDGSIGDLAHADQPSDHNPDETGYTPFKDTDRINEVHALDVDRSLKSEKYTMLWCVNTIANRHEKGQDNRLQNIIYNRQIASRSWGWTWRPYTGLSPHAEHAHFSARYLTEQENDTRGWGMYPLPNIEKKWNTISLDGFTVPEIHYGQADKDFTGYNDIGRIQRVLEIADDGYFGPKTLARLKEVFPGSDCTVMTVWMYSKLFGLTVTKS